MFIPRILSVAAPPYIFGSASPVLIPASGPKAAPSALWAILQGHEQTGVPGKEVLLGTTVIPAGAAIGSHTHAGDEFGSVLKGLNVGEAKRPQSDPADGRGILQSAPGRS
jgi:hypothetical protein